MNRFSPLLVYVVWGSILVVSLAFDRRAEAIPEACVNLAVVGPPTAGRMAD